MPKQQKKPVYKKVRKTNPPERQSRAGKQTAVKSSVQQPQKQTTVVLSKAKGRPMLVWVGKKPLERLTAFPAQKVEEYNPADTSFPNVPLYGIPYSGTSIGYPYHFVIM